MTNPTTEILAPAPLALPAPLVPVSQPQERERMTDTTAAAEQSVESVDPKGMTLMQVLATADQGQVAKALNASWDELLRDLMSLEVNEGVRKSKGRLTIKLGVEYEDGTVKLKVDEAVVTPKPPQRAAVYWVNGQGRLTPENPRQMTMFQNPPPARRVFVEQ